MITTVKFFKTYNEKKITSSPRSSNEYIYHITGQLCQTEQDLYNHFKKELNFPDYFGRNWDALVDCISDFCWLITDKVTIYITDIEYLLIEETDSKNIFYEIMFKDIVKRWKNAIFDDPDEYVTLNVVFNTTSKNEKFIIDLFKQYNVVESNLNEL